MNILNSLLKAAGRAVNVACLLLLALVAVVVLLLTIAACKPFAPENYCETVKTGGAIEAKYLASGPNEVANVEFPAPKPLERYQIYYPAKLAETDQRTPAIVSVNGTGVAASKYPAVLRRLASWGFIVIGNEDPGTFSGESANQTMAFLLEQNENKESVFYHKVDPDRLGIVGHSQGGVGVFNATRLADERDGARYAAAVSLSPTQEDWAAALHIPYDPSKTTVPTLVVAATKNDVISLDGMKSLFDKLPAERVVMRRICDNHGEMLYSADGYVTAWFMWKLQDDQDAALAFVGDSPELEQNKRYSDVMRRQADAPKTSQNEP